MAKQPGYARINYEMKPEVQPLSEVPISLSFGIDPDSDLLLDRGHCLRTIPSPASSFFERFVGSDCALRLVDKGCLISSETVSRDSGRGLVLNHPEIPFVLYPYEWTPNMLRDAALMVLDLVEVLEQSGYTLKDGHPWNVVFRGPNPAWVDLTSVGEKSVVGSFPGWTDLLNYFVRPLQLFAADLSPYARLGLTQWLGPPAAWFDDSLALRAARAYSSGARAALRFTAGTGKDILKRKLFRRGLPLHPRRPKSIDGLRKLISGLAVRPQPGEWTDYYGGKNELPLFDPNSPDFARLVGSTPKHRLVFSVLQALRPKTLLDIGCNTGLYSFMADSLGVRAVGLDTDEQAADDMYRAAKKRGANVTTGYADFVTPMRAADYLHKPRVRSLHSRMQADMVLCLAVVHHWVFKRTQLQFPDVVNILSEVTGRVLIVEFVPPDDKHISSWMTPSYSWYSLDNFLAALRKAFASVEVHDSFPAPRKLLVCHK